MSARRTPWPLRAVAVIAGGLALLSAVVYAIRFAPGLYVKAKGNSPDCSWRKALVLYEQGSDLGRRNTAVRASLVVTEENRTERSAKAQVRGRTRQFWISYARNGLEKELDLLAYLIADHDWVAALYPGETVRPGDVVIDCGAHVGVFTNKALELGAAKVIAVEPEPSRADCLRRTFQVEISAGRVEVRQVAVWERPGVMELNIWAGENTGTDSLLPQHGRASASVSVDVTTIDRMVPDLLRVDFIKMDIEGAEREALRGASATLRRFRPRLMLDSYHEADDAQVLPQVAREANPSYALTCGPCVSGGDRLVPHVIFLH